ncbi:MAG TPA: Fur family transcriptional regulator [Dissulfurispiraceae bacterium]|nr:Fur family transcriptional regulator [Dissulfurispiraceae bacterium]
MKKYQSIGMKLTPQRLAVLEYLDNNCEHPSADEIYRAVSARFPTMSFATVYNTLEALRQRGEVVELSIDPNRKRFDPNPHPHNHLICAKCRKIIDIHIDYKVELPDEAVCDFEITGSHIEFYGVCPDCMKNIEKPLASQKHQ